jgi:low affinity Fe/Cu permease
MAQKPSNGGKGRDHSDGGKNKDQSNGGKNQASAVAARSTDMPATHTERFSRFAQETARLAGNPATFILATGAVVIWALTGPLFNYSDTWQLVINTSTTIVTFLMVFLIQHTQNRDTMALQIKLSELIIAAQGAKNRLAAAEDLSEEELERLHKEYCGRADATMETLEQRRAAKSKKK